MNLNYLKIAVAAVLLSLSGCLLPASDGYDNTYSDTVYSLQKCSAETISLYESITAAQRSTYKYVDFYKTSAKDYFFFQDYVVHFRSLADDINKLEKENCGEYGSSTTKIWDNSYFRYVKENAEAALDSGEPAHAFSQAVKKLRDDTGIVLDDKYPSKKDPLNAKSTKHPWLSYDSATQAGADFIASLDTVDISKLPFVLSDELTAFEYNYYTIFQLVDSSLIKHGLHGFYKLYEFAVADAKPDPKADNPPPDDAPPPKKASPGEKAKAKAKLIEIFVKLGFGVPANDAQFNTFLKKAALRLHPDKGGTKEAFQEFGNWKDIYTK